MKSVTPTLRQYPVCWRVLAGPHTNGSPPRARTPAGNNNDNKHKYSHGKTADLEALDVPGKGFLWHLRRELNGQERGAEDGAGAASEGDQRACPTGSKRREQKRAGTGGAREGGEKERQGEQARRPGGRNDCVAISMDQEATQDDLLVVLPPVGGKEVAGYTGGYTVKRHGLLAGQGVAPGSTTDGAAGAAGGRKKGAGRNAVVVDAVQLEFGARFRRTPEARAAAAEAVAAALFYHLQQR